MAYRIILDSPADGVTHADEIFTGDADALSRRMSDLWNRYAAHMPGRGYRCRAREILAPATARRKEQRGKICASISG